MYNKAIVVGRLTADPELRQTQNGHSVTSFSLAVDRPYSTREGEQDVDFLNIVAWRGTAEFVCRYFTKGRPMLVDGSIQTRTYTDRNGVERRVWEIVADQVRFVESRSAAQGDTAYSAPNTGAQSSSPSPAEQAAQPASYSSGSVDDFAEIEDDGDLPF